MKNFLNIADHSSSLLRNIIEEAKEILDVKDVIASILLVENLRIQKN